MLATSASWRHEVCMRVLLALVLCSTLTRCGGDRGESPSASSGDEVALALPSPESFAREHPSFERYWYQGLAELSRYELSQSRYGELHEGEAVLIFVTEDFLPGPQVKHELGPRPDDAISVLKLNAHRQFDTGIYPYTVMTSTFAPAEGGRALKLAASVVEWCGVAYAQLNRREDGIRARLHSYFEAEGDQDLSLEDAWTEDELLVTLRRGPDAIPRGPMRLIPAMHFLRFAHRPLAAYDATVEIEGTGARRTLVIRYAELPREVRVDHHAAFPYVIEGWEERGDGPTTVARRTHAVLTDYWAHNGVDDGAYRRVLGR